MKLSKPSGIIMSYKDYVNENYLFEDGIGGDPFFFSKNGDVSNYFFKIDNTESRRSFVLSIGKFSKFAQPSEKKTDYAVLDLIELTDSEMDKAIIADGKFDVNDSKIGMTDRELSKLLETLTLCVSDYLQKNSKVSTFYDEIQNMLKQPLYSKLFAASLKNWPGEWKLQEFEKGKLNLISK